MAYDKRRQAMKLTKCLIVMVAATLVSGCAFMTKTTGPGKGEYWRALHLINFTNDKALDQLGGKIPKLAEMGLNVLVLEVDYSFDFKSHPELRMDNYITAEGAKKFAALCKKYDIRLIPQFQCLGHQSWAKNTFTLLTKYPELDLTPGAFPGNEGLYCREWDVTNPRVYELVFDLIDEIIVAFDADAIHVGMDEVFLLGSDESPSTKGKNPAELFAKAVNDMYGHIVKKCGCEMLMWADRFIDGNKFDLGKWEASQNGTAPSVDMVPKDIILCPWHYTPHDSYPSIPMFLAKGFRVLPASWKDVEASQKLIHYSLGLKNPNMLGHCFTTWGEQGDDITAYPPMTAGMEVLRKRK